MRTVLITGATGFIGRALCVSMRNKGWRVRGIARSDGKRSALPTGVEPVCVEMIGPETDWSGNLHNLDAVVHLAASVHVLDHASNDSRQDYFTVNTSGTERLAQQAAMFGVSRFIYISTVKVHGMGEMRPYTERDIPAPKDPYSVSKWEAEKALRRVEAETGLPVVILRPPLVYGPEVRANFLRLMKWVVMGLPMPFGSIRNRRSMIYLGSLTDAIVSAIDCPASAGETFLISDGQDLSTPQLIRILAAQMGKKQFLLPCPPAFLRTLGRIAGKSKEIDRLTGSLFIDCSKIRRVLDWKPPFSVEEGLRETVRWYIGS